MGHRATLVIVCVLALGAAVCAFGKENDEWVRVDTPNFVLFGNVSGRRLVEVGRRVEKFREILPRTIQGLSLKSAVPTFIYVFHSADSFGAYHLGSDGKPRQIVGLFVPGTDANYVTMDASGSLTPYDVVQRGYMHKVLADTLPGIPLWVNEGLSEFLGSARPDTGGGRAELGRPISMYLDLLHGEKLIPLDRLLVISPSSFEYDNPERMAVFSAESWALIHWFFVEDAQRRGHFLEFVSRLKAGEEANKAFKAAIGMEPQDIQAQLEKYLHQGRYGMFSIKFDESLASAEYTAAPISRAETLFRLGDLLTHIPPIRYIDADRHLRAALELEPGHAGAQAALAALSERRRKLSQRNTQLRGVALGGNRRGRQTREHIIGGKAKWLGAFRPTV